MKITFKKASLILSVILVAGFVIFSACKKEEDPAGTKAAKELCDCASKSNEYESLGCIIQWIGKYIDQIEVEIDEETGELSGMSFKDKSFERDFESQIVRCEAMRE